MFAFLEQKHVGVAHNKGGKLRNCVLDSFHGSVVFLGKWIRSRLRPLRHFKVPSRHIRCHHALDLAHGGTSRLPTRLQRTLRRRRSCSSEFFVCGYGYGFTGYLLSTSLMQITFTFRRAAVLVVASEQVMPKSSPLRGSDLLRPTTRGARGC